MTEKDKVFEGNLSEHTISLSSAILLLKSAQVGIFLFFLIIILL